MSRQPTLHFETGGDGGRKQLGLQLKVGGEFGLKPKLHCGIATRGGAGDFPRDEFA